MKPYAFVVAVMAQAASAHYFFDSVVANGAAGPSFQYIRDFTRATKYNPIKYSNNPAVDIRDGSYVDGPDIRCNQGAFTNAGRTNILEVAAGNSVTVKLGVGATMQHPGPALFYMSKAPGDVKAYDGSGDWFKIGQEGVCNKGGDFTKDAWCTWDRNTVTATVPKDTPAGEYLLRVEHIGIHKSHVKQPEHFVSCVQVKVTGNGKGTPGPLVKFPGAYKYEDPYVSFSIYGGYKEFPFPGPAVWSGGSSDTLALPTESTATTPKISTVTTKISTIPTNISTVPTNISTVPTTISTVVRPTAIPSGGSPVRGCAAKARS